MKHYVLVLALVLCHLSCAERSSGDNIEATPVTPSSSIPSQAEIDQLLESAIKDGNGDAYQQGEAYYFIQGEHDTFFYYAFLMAKRHKHARAYFDLYYIMAGSSPGIKPINELDASTRDFSLYCLLRAYELNERSAKIYVEELFAKAIPKSESYRQGIFE